MGQRPGELCEFRDRQRRCRRVGYGPNLAHGAAVAGRQGIGVRTPSAAAVAAATIGLAGLEHMPNGATFTIGA